MLNDFLFHVSMLMLPLVCIVVLVIYYGGRYALKNPAKAIEFGTNFRNVLRK